MEKIINLDIPHVGEHIFASINTPDLVKFLEVSETWKALAENVLLKRWKGKMFEACEKGETKVVQLLLENLTSEENEIPFLFLGRLLGNKGCVSSPYSPVASPKSLNLILSRRNF